MLPKLCKSRGKNSFLKEVEILKLLKHFFGLRKIKSVLAVAICFGLWQLIRIPFPEMEPHPIYAYFYAIIEMRNQIDMQKRTSWSRLKANIVGFCLAFVAIAIFQLISQASFYNKFALLIEFSIILIGILLALNLAELFKCTTLCAIAALTFIICFRNENNPYLYAVLRFVQTLMSVGVAYAVNTLICKPSENNN